MHAAIDHAVPKGFVHFLRELVFDQRIRSHFQASLGPGPIFRGAKQPLADSLPSMILVHKPAFDVTDSLRIVTSIGMRSQARFEKADHRAIVSFSNDKSRGELQKGRPVENSCEMRSVLLGFRFWPERFAQARELALVRKIGGPDGNILRRCFSFCHTSIIAGIAWKSYAT